MAKRYAFFCLLLVFGCNESKDPQVAMRETANQGLEVAAKAESKGHYADAINALKDAAPVYRNLAQMTRATEDWADLISCLNQLGWDQMVYSSDFKAAGKVLLDAKAIAEEWLPEAHRQTIRNLHNLAVLAYYENRLNDALDLNREVLALRKRLPDQQREIAATQNNLGMVYRAKGDLNQARQHYERSLTLKIESSGPDHGALATSYQNLGHLYHLWGDFDKAIDLLQKAYRLRQRDLNPDHPDIASSAYVLGRAYLEIGDMDRAEPVIEKALEIQQKVLGEDHPHWAHSLWEMAKIQVHRNQFDAAVNGLKQAQAIFTNHFGEENYHLAENLQNLGWVAWKKGDFETSLTYLDQAIAVFKPGDDASTSLGLIDETMIRCLHGKATVRASRYLREGQIQDLEIALEAIKGAMQVATVARRRILSEESQLNLARRSRKLIDFGVDIAMALHRETSKEDYLIEAFQLADQGKMVVLRDAINNVELQQIAGLPPDYLNREKSLRQKGYQLESQAAHQLKSDGEVNAQIQQNLLDHTHQVETFLTELEATYPRYFELKYRDVTPDMEQYRAALPPVGTSLVAYHLDEEWLTTFVLDPTRIVAVQRPLDHRMADGKKPIVAKDWLVGHGKAPPMNFSDVGKLRSSLIFAKQDVFRYYAHRLYELLIAPIAQAIEGQDLVIVPDGNLAFLPFEVLLSMGAQEGEQWDLAFLVKNHQVGYVHAAGLLSPLQRPKRVGESPRGIAFAPVFKNSVSNSNALRLQNGDTQRSPKVAPLPHSKREVEALEQLFLQAGGDLTVWLQEKANKKAFLEALGQGGTIHLATHAVVDEEFPALSRLLFSDSNSQEADNALYLGEIFALNFDTDLVVLSACETGRGRIASGEGVMGFVRGLHYAGARQILVSLWQVADESTSQFMLQFYGEFLGGVSAEQALHAAKLKAIELGWPPYAWAGFVLIGAAN